MVHAMASRRHLSPELVNSFLREVQEGNLPDLSGFLQSRSSSGSPGDLLMCTNKHGDTPLLMAARHGHLDLLRRLLEDYEVPLEHTNTDGKTALHEVAQNGHVECADFLVHSGARVDCLKRADWTPLMLACTKECEKMVEALVGHGASLSLRNKDGWTPFFIACREGHPNIINYLLDTDSQCWDTKSKNGRIPLHTVALHGRLEAAKILLKRCQFDPNAADSCGVTPLMDAVRGNHTTMTQFLLREYDASLHAEDILGRQAIHHAAQGGATNALEYVIQEGANVNKLASVNNISPLHYAAKEGNAGAISLLLKYGADPTLRDKRGRTALDVARNARNSTAAVEVLEKAEPC